MLDLLCLGMDYATIKAKCQQVSTFSEPILTQLMYYAAERNKLSQRFDNLAKKNKHVFGRLDKSNQAMFKTQYIIHEVLKDGGLIHKYLNHSAIKVLPQKEYDYLQQQASTPWKFTYWSIRSNPSPDFFESVDIFTGEEFLLYSPGASRTLQEMNAITFGGLISSNGACYQSYGPLMGFKSFQADDIFYYAGELDDTIESVEDLTAYINEDLFSFLLLSVFSGTPMVRHQEHEILNVVSSMDFTDFKMEQWQEDFRVEYSGTVFKMSLKGLESFPHFACAYFDEQLEELLLSAMTDYGYNKLIEAMVKLNIEVPKDPDIRLHLSMGTAINDIMGYESELVPYEELFSQDSDTEEQSPELEAINSFLALLMLAINAKGKVDLDAMIAQTGADPQAAKSIYEDMMKKLGK